LLKTTFRAGKEWTWVTDIHAGCLLTYLTLPYNTTTTPAAEGQIPTVGGER